MAFFSLALCNFSIKHAHTMELKEFLMWFPILFHLHSTEWSFASVFHIYIFAFRLHRRLCQTTCSLCVSVCIPKTSTISITNWTTLTPVCNKLVFDNPLFHDWIFSNEEKQKYSLMYKCSHTFAWFFCFFEHLNSQRKIIYNDDTTINWVSCF